MLAIAGLWLCFAPRSDTFSRAARSRSKSSQPLSRATDPTLVRHIHDLHRVREHIDRAVVVALARTISVQDGEEFAHQHPAYRVDIAAQSRKALAFLNDDPAVAARYNSFVAAMVYGHQSLFRDAIATVSEIAEQVWP